MLDLATEVTRAIPTVRRLAETFSRNYPFAEVEELAQEGCVGLLEAASRYDAGRGASLATFGGKRVVGAILDHIRWVLNGRRLVSDTACWDEDSSGPECSLPARDSRSAESQEMVLRFRRFLRAAWPDLPEPAREVVRRRYLEGESVREVAAALGVSLATVARRERAGLDWLRERFRECGYGRDLGD